MIGVKGPKEFAEEVKQKATMFLSKNLHIQVNQEKTRITHMTSQKAHFLGVDIFRRSKKYQQTLVTRKNGLLNRKVNNRIIMYAPIEKIINKLFNQNFIHQDKKPRAITK